MSNNNLPLSSEPEVTIMDGIEGRARCALAFLRQAPNAWIPDRDMTIRLISLAIDQGRLQMLGGTEQRVGLAAERAERIDDTPVINTIFTLRAVLMFLMLQKNIQYITALRWRNVRFTIEEGELRATRVS